MRRHYRLGVPQEGFYNEIFNTDSEYYGGSNVGNHPGVATEPQHHHGRRNSICITLPPLATVVFKLK